MGIVRPGGAFVKPVLLVDGRTGRAICYLQSPGNEMIYFKSILVGIVAAIVASILWILVAFVLPILGPFLLSRVTGSGGGASAWIGSGSILAAAFVGFVVGSYWQFRRLSKRRAHTE